MSSSNPTPDQQGAFDRLSKADPAAGTAPDLAAVRGRVDAELAGEAPGTQAPVRPETDDAPGGTVVPLVRTRQPARWFQVAAASAGVLAIGLGGYAVGHQSADETVVADAPVETAVAQPAPETDSQAGLEPAPLHAGGRTMEAADMTMPSFGGHTVFDSVGLSDAPGRARAWAFDGSAVYSEATAARVAAAFGLTEAPVLSSGQWHVGPLDWTGVFVGLTPNALASFNFTDSTRDPWSEDGTAPADDVATAALTDLMTELGVDAGAYEVTVEESYGAAATIVRATRLVDGRATGLTWEATVTQDGFASAYGHLASPVDLGEYDVVSPQEAVARLTDPRFGQSNVLWGPAMVAGLEVPDDAFVGPTPEQAYPEMESGGSSDKPAADEPSVVEPAPAQPGVDTLSPVPTVPPAPAPGTSFAWPVEQVTITGATLTVAVHTQPDGSTVLLPTYELTSDDGSTWSVVAVADAQLDFAAGS